MAQAALAACPDLAELDDVCDSRLIVVGTLWIRAEIAYSSKLWHMPRHVLVLLSPYSIANNTYEDDYLKCNALIVRLIHEI